MIAEKAADMIRGRQLEPYEPDHGSATPAFAATHYSAAFRPAPMPPAAHSRALGLAGAGDQVGAAGQRHVRAHDAVAGHGRHQRHQFNYTDLRHLNQDQHLRQHHQFVHNKYANSFVAEAIMKRMAAAAPA